MPFSAIVMAAGRGTRMRSQTPKVLHDLCGRPMVGWPVAAAQEAGAVRVVVVQGPDGELDGRLGGVELATQPVADGTGGAVAAALTALEGAEGAVVVLSGDVPLVSAEAIAALVEAHAAAGAQATMATTRLADPAGYGRVVRDADGRVARVVETKADGDAAPEHLAIDEINTGIFCFDLAALRQALPRVGSENAQRERYLPDVLPLLDDVAAHVVDDPDLVLGINDRVQLAQARVIAQRSIIDAHARSGVTFIAPQTNVVDVTVTIGEDTTIEPGTILRGATTVGAGATVGPNTTVNDSSIGDGSRVLHSYLLEAEVRERVSVGPFAYLRPGTVLRAGSKVGTFVEIKNSDIGAGTKVPHLSYLGDADVGEGSNLGASTVTANYDGKAKHRTTIGSNVRSSVDVTFVAPVTVGDGAVTGAGSVITEDVPPGALGIARERQTNIEGYAERDE